MSGFKYWSETWIKINILFFNNCNRSQFKEIAPKYILYIFGKLATIIKDIGQPTQCVIIFAPSPASKRVKNKTNTFLPKYQAHLLFFSKMLCIIFGILLRPVPGLFGKSEMDYYSDFGDEGSGLELVHVSDVLDYLGGLYYGSYWRTAEYQLLALMKSKQIFKYIWEKSENIGNAFYLLYYPLNLQMHSKFSFSRNCWP